MRIIEVVKIAIQALGLNKMRSLLTMLGIIIGVSSVILLISIGVGLQSYVTKQLSDLGTDTLFVMPGELEIQPGGGGGGGVPGAGVAASKFTFEHVRDIEREAKTVKNVMGYTENNGTMKYKTNTHITQVAGVSPDYPETRNQKVSQGVFFNNSQYNSAKRVVVLGTKVADDLFGKENPVGQKITLSDSRYTVLGVLEEKGAFGGVSFDDQVFIPTTTAMRQFDMRNIQSLWLRSISPEKVPQTALEVKVILGKTLKEDEFSVLDTKSILNIVSNILGILTVALGGIAAISLLVGGIGIMNIMLVSVAERTHEIGLRKAIGATEKVILIQFLAEAIILSFIGGLIGILLGIGGSIVINHFFTTVVTIWSIGLAFGVSALVGIIFGTAPAIRAARLNPIDALRFE